jgi:MFS transporter, SP family, general alpha glucoside:H+ symporter
LSRNASADLNPIAEAGISPNLAFALGLITSALQMVFVMLSWILTTYFGRRPLYLWGTGFNTLLLVCLGIAASVGASQSASFAQASLGLIVSVTFTLAAAPVSWVVIGETSAIRLRPLTTGIGRATYYIVEIPCIFRKSPFSIFACERADTETSCVLHAQPDWRKP